jgi:hypothetical protein
LRSGLLHPLNVHHGLEANIDQRTFFSGRQVQGAIAAQAQLIHGRIPDAEDGTYGGIGGHGETLLLATLFYYENRSDDWASLKRMRGRDLF